MTTSLGAKGDLLAGSHDCVDRVVLNAFFPVGNNPGGFRCWWRLHGGLPHALQITAALLAAGPAVTAAGLAGQLSDETQRLTALRYDDGSGASTPAVATVFGLCYAPARRHGGAGAPAAVGQPGAGHLR